MVDAFLRFPQVIAITGYSEATIRRKIKRGEFPPAIQIGDRAVGWLHSEVMAWMEARVKLSRGTRELQHI